ncbi:hypothetical protein [Mesorhizobium sp. NZP2077]|uniref:hypothetical protein n=1 Tax=Mesorhizobium sp. NZP2077 TaxID=2483404 RepID=UPI00155366A7|nr:hypothetical protein [Mesorhizobium sp. NZP2077]QKC84160.1 hypothetical protein EB232_23475 [Mesorhizobium sp. NZP2077]QKD17709.1 hypothetical protein HGP13_23165 [Mesorhizobium sp. NZP2077]
MTRSYENLDDLQGDLRKLSTLINVIEQKVFETPDIDEVGHLLWIARDLAEQIVTNSEDVCSSQNIVKQSRQKAN